LSVVDMPVFIVRPAPIYQVPKDQSITLPCVAEGDPKPSIIWKKVFSILTATSLLNYVIVLVQFLLGAHYYSCRYHHCRHFIF